MSFQWSYDIPQKMLFQYIYSVMKLVVYSSLDRASSITCSYFNRDIQAFYKQNSYVAY